MSIRPTYWVHRSDRQVSFQRVTVPQLVRVGVYRAKLGPGGLCVSLNKSVLVRRRTFLQYLDNHNTTKYHQESIIERIHVPMFEPLMLELRHSVGCARENRPSQVSGSDGLRALQLAETVSNEVAHQRVLRLRDAN
jgi:hypothetical protein